MTTTFVVDRNDLRGTHWVDAPAPSLQEGELRLTVDGFALTSNNVTYAAFGSTMNYWCFFPTGDAETGCIPVWGFGTVTESRCAGVVAGERFYGYFPMATDVVLRPDQLSANGFVDKAAHRRELHAVYNRYTRCSSDPGYVAALEAEQALLRPLFTTSFLIDDFLDENQFFGARTVVMSSASSKTAYGTAFCFARNRRSQGTARVIGLTSAPNVVFTRRLGCYDEVLAYESIDTLPLEPTVYVDFSGSAALRLALHSRFAERLVYSCAVGGTHWEALGGAKALPGARPVLFFAPAQAAKRIDDWGASTFLNHLAESWSAFIAVVTDPRDPWLRVVRGRGCLPTQKSYQALLAGGVPPQDGHYLTLAPE